MSLHKDNKSPRGLKAHLSLMNSHLMQAPCGATRGMSSITKAVKILLDLLNLLCFAIRNIWRYAKLYKDAVLALESCPRTPHGGQ